MDRRGVGELLFTKLLKHQVMQMKEIKYIIGEPTGLLIDLY